MSQAILALDLGTSSIKALLVDRQGTIISRGRVPHATLRPSATAAAQEPADWWANAQQIIAQLCKDTRGNVAVAAISVTGQMHGLVLHDRFDQLMGNAIIWQDGRAAATLPDLLDRLPADHSARPDAAISPGYQVASWHRLSQRDPELSGRTRRLLLPKDELIYRLTGRHVTDPSDAVGSGMFDVRVDDWDAAIIDAADVPPAVLPPLSQLAASSVRFWRMLRTRLDWNSTFQSSSPVVMPPLPHLGPGRSRSARRC